MNSRVEQTNATSPADLAKYVLAIALAATVVFAI